MRDRNGVDDNAPRGDWHQLKRKISDTGSVQEMIAERRKKVEEMLAKSRSHTTSTNNNPDNVSDRSVSNRSMSDGSRRNRSAEDIERTQRAKQIESIKAKLASNSTLIDLKSRRGRHSRGRTATRSLLEDNVKPVDESLTVEEAQRSKKTLQVVKPDTRSLTDSPFYDPRASATLKPRSVRRQFKFNPHGRYIEEAETLRKQAKMEELKKKIAMTSKKTGILDNFDALSKNFKVEEPPSVEWWDSGILPNESYDNIENIKLNNENSIITSLIQHPVLINPPYEKNMSDILSVKLTPREMKKLRREKRSEARKELHDKQMLGLIEPEPPKVKIANMYKVYGDAAIKDPTRIEAQVRAQIQQRQDKHEQMNLLRKLTPEERREKLERKKEEDANRGIYSCAFKIHFLAHRPHRLKIDLNAQQDGLTGICILNPDFNLVVVEGGMKGIKHYKNLMLRRIDWTNATTTEGNEIVGYEYDKNSCSLIWEGEIKSRNFRRWGFKRCETDEEAREALKLRGKAEHFWNVAKNHSGK